MLKTEEECIEYIHSCGRFGKKEGLSNMRALLNALGNPQKDLKYIHIAGTNGKGSVACMISNILCAHKYKVGMNTSPFIEYFNERLQINNKPISAQKLIYYTNCVKNAIDKLNKTDCHPIEFELITAIGFLYFRDEKCDFVVLECGIGGRLDSTNVIEDPLLCIICNIGIDHTYILGNTIQDIAYEKAGIIKQNSKVILHPSIKDAALDVIQKKAEECNSKIYKVNNLPIVINRNFDGTDLKFDNLQVHINLLGSYQIPNAALAVKAALILSQDYELTDNDILCGMKNAKWKCRFEFFKNNCIIDGAHNYQGICEFVKSVEMYLADKNKVFVVGMLNEKDFCKSAEVLKNLEGKIIVTDVPNDRQTSGEEIYDCIKNVVKKCEYITNYKSAIEKAFKEAGNSGFVCIVGSLYLAGAARLFINE